MGSRHIMRLATREQDQSGDKLQTITRDFYLSKSMNNRTGQTESATRYEKPGLFGPRIGSTTASAFSDGAVPRILNPTSVTAV